MQNIKINSIFKILFVSLVAVLAFSACNLKSSDVKGQFPTTSTSIKPIEKPIDINRQVACKYCCIVEPRNTDGSITEEKRKYLEDLASAGYLYPGKIAELVYHNCLTSGEADALAGFYIERPLAELVAGIVKVVPNPTQSDCCKKTFAADETFACQATVDLQNFATGQYSDILQSAYISQLLVDGCVVLDFGGTGERDCCEDLKQYLDAVGNVDIQQISKDIQSSTLNMAQVMLWLNNGCISDNIGENILKTLESVGVEVVNKPYLNFESTGITNVNTEINCCPDKETLISWLDNGYIGSTELKWLEEQGCVETKP